MKNCFLIILLSFVFHFNYAQISVKGPRIGIGYLANTYFGDLNAQEKLHRFYPGVHLNLSFETQKSFMLGFNILFGQFIAQTRNLPPVDGIQPNSFVKTSFTNASFLLKYRPFFKNALSPFLGAGLGLLNFTPKNEQNQNLSSVLSTRTPGESYSSTGLCLPLNTGVDLKLSRNFSLGLNYFYVFTSTDYLDNIGKLGSTPGNDKIMQLSLSMQFVLESESRKGR